MKKRLIVFIFTGILAMFALTACGSEEDEQSNNENVSENSEESADASEENSDSLTGEGLNEADTVVIGYCGNVMPVILADRIYNILQEDFGEDVTVQYETFEDGPAGITALVSGSVDVFIGVMSLPVVTSGSNGSEYKLISCFDYNSGTYICAEGDSDVESIEDIAGLRVGVSLGTMGQYALQKKLEENGLTTDDIELINISSSDMVTAFRAGELDVMVGYYVLVDSLLNSGEAKKIDEADPSKMWILANEDYAEENPEIVAQVLTYYDDVFAYFKENEDTVISEIVEKFDADEDTIQHAWELSPDSYINDVGDDALEELAEVQEFALENELITDEYDIESYIDNTYVTEAARLISE